MSNEMEMELQKINDKLELLVKYKHLRVECTEKKTRGTILSYLNIGNKACAIVLFDDTLEINTVPIKNIKMLAATEQHV